MHLKKPLAQARTDLRGCCASSLSDVAIITIHYHRHNHRQQRHTNEKVIAAEQLMVSSVRTVRAKGARDQIDTLDVVLRSFCADVLVFFPGDISAGHDEMVADPDLSQWQDWNTEALAAILASRFSEFHIVLVRPSRQHEGYSCFDHFLETNSTGDPLNGTYSPGSAAEHLLLLLRDLSKTFGLRQTPRESLYVLGFSKGGTVLNQLLTEIGQIGTGGNNAAGAAGAEQRSFVSLFLSVLRALVWLDAGVNDGCCVFVSDENVMRLAASKLRLTRPLTRLGVVFSPFQLYSEDYVYEYEDEEIPATAMELGLDRLQSVMLQESIPFEVELCCFDRQASLETHFQVIREFTLLGCSIQPQDAPCEGVHPKRSTTFAAALHAARNGVQRAKTLSLTCSCM